MKNANKESGALISGISRHRLATDGEGVTTLVGFHGCPLCCGYFLNPHTQKNVNLQAITKRRPTSAISKRLINTY